MSRSKSSRRWLREHFKDQFVQSAQKDGYRSRASYKLLELHQRDKLFAKGMRVIDLGAAPGGWSQVASELVGERGAVVASDILPMDSLAGVQFVEGDFTDESILACIMAVMAGRRADLVISDMAPNMSGVIDVDQPKSMYLVELAMDLAKQVLKTDGTLVMKAFQGEGFDQFMRDCRGSFAKVVTRKPEASRPRSREVYIVAKGFSGA